MLTQKTLTQLLKICEDTKSAELTGHDNLVYDVITMENFKEVLEFAIEAKDYLEVYLNKENDDLTNKYCDKMMNVYWIE